MFFHAPIPLSVEGLNAFFTKHGVLPSDILEKDGLAEEYSGLPGLLPEVDTALRRNF